MQVAETLGKFVWEVEDMSPDELAEWIAWFGYKAEVEKKEADRARRQSKSRRV